MPYFHAVDYIPWIGSTIAEFLVVGIMLRRDLVRRFPVFFSSVVFDLLRELAFPAVIHQSCPAELPTDSEVRKLIHDAHIKGLKVYWRVTRLTFLLGFRPALARDCRRVTEAAVQHGEALIAYFRLLRAQYPAEMGHVELPE